MDKRIYPQTIKFNEEENKYLHSLAEVKGISVSTHIQALVKKDKAEAEATKLQLIQILGES